MKFSDNQSLKDHQGLLILILILAIVVLLVTGVTNYLLYDSAFERMGERLLVATSSHARLIEAVARHETEVNEGPEVLHEALEWLKQIHEDSEVFGSTMECVLAYREKNQINFLFRQRHGEFETPKPISFDSEFAEPMRRALLGQSGRVVGRDYRGEAVLAAFEPVSLLNLGVVAKIDLAEIRAPFVKTGIVTGALALVAILAGALLFIRITNPIIRNLQKSRDAEKLARIQLKDTIENLPVGLCLYDDKERLVLANEKMEQLFPEAEGWGSLLPGTLFEERVRCASRGLMAGARGREEEWVRGRIAGFRRHGSSEGEGQLSDGRWFHALDRKTPQGFTVSIRVDITQRKRAEEHFRGLAEGSIQGILVHRNFKILFANRAMADLIGYESVEAVLAMDMNELPYFAPHERDSVRESATARLRGDRLSHKTMRQGIKKDGTSIWMEALATLVTWEGETAIQVVYTDITERKRAEDELRSSRRLFQTVFDVVPVGLFVKGTDARLTMVNPAFAALSREEVADLVGKLPGEVAIGTPAEIEKMEADDRRVLETGETVESPEGKVTFPDGTVRYHHTIKAPLRDENGEITGIVGVRQDIDDRKRVEDELRNSRQLLQTLIDSLPVWVTAKDTKLRYTWVNQRLLDDLQLTREQCIGTDRFVASDAVWEQASNLDRQVLATGKRAEIEELRHPFPNGSFRLMHHIKVPWLDPSGAIEGIVTTSLDITERRQLESQLRQAQKMEAVGTLAGGIAHNFNNLLQVILSSISLLQMELGANEAHSEMLGDTVARVQQGASLTRQLLGFARGGKYEVKVVDLTHSILNSAKMVADAHREISVRHQFQPILWKVRCDEGQMEQVFLNLFVNAQQAMPHGGEILVQGENATLEDKDAKALETAPGRYVRISVADTGIGMSEETQARIFEPFFTTKGLAQGSGLGLSSVYGIVKHHDGVITVDSAVGEGTTFRIYLPASGEEAEAAKAQPRVEPAGGSGTILFVDDEEDLVTSGRRGLQRLGFEVLVAASGPEALEVFESNQGRVSLVVLGLTMPGMGGGEVFDKLREINPKVKVILSSGYGLEDEPGEIMKRGCDAFVQKPYDPDNLAQLVGEVLNRD